MSFLLLQTVLLTGALEAWPADHADSLQHRYAGQVTVQWDAGPVRFAPFMGLVWWGRPDAKIPSSFLNLEASRVLERTYGATVTVGGTCRVGAWWGRRGVEWLGAARVWGRSDGTRAGATLGYWDGVRPLAACTFTPSRRIALRGPLLRYHPLTLPWHELEGAARLGPLTVTVGAFGPRPGTVLDVGLARRVGSLTFSAQAGQIAHPGWGTPVRRVAARVTVGSTP